VALAALSLAWIAGIFLGSFFSPSPFFFLFALVPLPLLIFRKLRRDAAITCLILIFLAGGMFCYQASLPAGDTSNVSFYNDSGEVTLRGTVSLDPDVRDKTTHLKLYVESIGMDDDWQPVSGMVMLYVPRYPAYSYGDFLEVSGILQTPQNFEDFD
jgi:competence protein ComEC